MLSVHVYAANHYLFVFDLCNNIKHKIMRNVHQSVPLRALKFR